MPIPDILKIERIEDYHTHFLGEYGNGNLFFGYEHFVFDPNGKHENWQENRHEYVVLYLFDKSGNLASHKYWYAGTTAALNCDPHEKLQEMVDELGEVEYCDISVKPFQIEIDHHVFGLIAIADPDYERVELHPSNTIAFSKPWEGEYDT